MTKLKNSDIFRLSDVYSSYYGKLTCVDWSPDGRYILVSIFKDNDIEIVLNVLQFLQTGGEDDLVTIWAFHERKMIARCEGHKSWVTSVAFDKWRCDEQTYRFGSVGEDCNLILWDFSFSALQKPKHVSLNIFFIEVGMFIHFFSQPRAIATSPSAPRWPPPQPQPLPAVIVERKKSLKNHRLFRGFSSPDTATISNSSNATGTGSFGRFRKRSSRSHNIFTANGEGDYEEEQQQPPQQYLPIIHPALKKNQAAILQPTTIKAVHADPCVSLVFREDSFTTTDRRGRIRTWGRP